MIEALDKAYVINGEFNDKDNSGASGMLIYDFKQQTWDYNDTIPWKKWSGGVVNHLAFDNPSSNPGYIVGFAGRFRAPVSQPWQ